MNAFSGDADHGLHQGMRAITGAVLLWGVLVLLLATGSSQVPALQQIRDSGTLRAAMVNDPTSYYLGPAGYTGFDYDLIRDFADHLGVTLDIALVDTTDDALEAVRQGRVQIAAISAPVTPARANIWRWSRPLRYRTPQLVGRSGMRLDDTMADPDTVVAAPEGGAYLFWLELLGNDYPDLRVDVRVDTEAEALLADVADGREALTVAGSDLVAITQRYYPRLQVMSDIGPPRPMAWAVAADNGASLHAALAHYLRLLGSTELHRLRDRYFGHVDRLGYVDAVALATHFETRLPTYRDKFEAAAAEYGIDWRLLAAVGYQESLWNNNAVSPTGVRGLMQITLQTADFLDISDRMDPAESILGAARYLRSLHGRLPDSIEEPDRSWFMLASYNIGLGHVLDARRLTESRGDDPDRWVDVRQHLPLLTQPRHYRNLRYGYARGPEAVKYVGNIRTYFDMLVWLTSREPTAPVPVRPDAHEMRPPQGHDPLGIEQSLF